MKKNIILLGTMLLFVTGVVSAQVCPPTNNGRSAFNRGYSNAGFSSFGASNFSLDRLTFSVNSIISEGYANGNLTDHEIQSIERDYRNVEREMRFAYADRRITFHERSMINMYMRRLNRNIEREWNDNDVRIG